MEISTRKHPDTAKKSRRARMKDERKKARRLDVQASQKAWRALSATEQLAALDRRLGVGIGATKQRARLAPLAEAEKAKAAEPKTSEKVSEKNKSKKTKA